jgi:hypothetical protein
MGVLIPTPLPYTAAGADRAGVSFLLARDVIRVITMNVDADVRAEAVTVYVDGEAVGTVGRDWWDDWTARIDNDPETCLAACLDADGRPAGSRPG